MDYWLASIQTVAFLFPPHASLFIFLTKAKVVFVNNEKERGGRVVNSLYFLRFSVLSRWWKPQMCEPGIIYLSQMIWRVWIHWVEESTPLNISAMQPPLGYNVLHFWWLTYYSSSSSSKIHRMVHSTEIAWPHNENGFLFMTLFKSLQWAVVQNVVGKASFTNASGGAGLQLRNL